MTVRHGSSPNSWKTMARSIPGPVIFLPPISSSPTFGRSSPSSTFRKVLLPQPDGPTMETNSPLFSSMRKSLRAVTGSRFLGVNVSVMSVDRM